jgi:predicted membrane-bound dolichyl-phosphate-mannose-protein mannosyltransferase
MDTKTTDRMVELARFQHPAEAQTLVALLHSEGIDCYIRNEHSSQMLAGIDVGGARVEILESDVAHAMDVMKNNGYDFPEEDETPDNQQTTHGWPLEKQIMAILFLLIVLLALLICGGIRLT